MTTPKVPSRSPASLYQEGLRHLDEASRATRTNTGSDERIIASASLATAYFAAATLALTFQRMPQGSTARPLGDPSAYEDAVLPTPDGSATVQASPAVVSLRRQARRFGWTELEGDVNHLLFGHGNRLLAAWLVDGEVTAAALDGMTMPGDNVSHALRRLGIAASSDR